MTMKLVPHTSEWFEALGRFNPNQAGLTASIVMASGRLDVCSVCGDDPAAIYEIDVPHVDPQAVRTLRLCSDCLRIRSAQGETYVPA